MSILRTDAFKLADVFLALLAASDLVDLAETFLSLSRSNSCFSTAALIDLVDNLGEKFKGILLLPHIDRLAPQLEALPELVWHKVLQLGLQEVAKDRLQLVEH